MYRPPHIERNWNFLVQVAIPEQLRALGDYPEVVYQTLVRRGYDTINKASQFIDFRKFQPCSPFELPDMDKAISRILYAIDSGKRIGVWGDFDVDGQTSTTILVSALRKIGADHCYHIPIRGPESHGIGLRALEEFIKQGVEVILTCDTGVSAVDAITYAQSGGVDVVVTDHHLLPEKLPPAYALVNPQRMPATHPLAAMPGAGVAYKFAEALLTEKGYSKTAFQMHDLAALGCVADLAQLTGETRYLVQSGLNLLRSTPRPAVLALLQAASVDYMKISEEHISFTLAPRLNAVGRLDDANPLVNFLLSEDPVEIAVMVNKVEGLNSRRKFLCDQVFQGALAQIEQDRTLLDQPILILQHQEWPAGVVGIVASRLVEIFHRPVILLVSSADATLRGSARSVEGIDITAALTFNQKHLLSFGGHPMAAGLVLQAESIDSFKREMYRTIGEMTSIRAVSADLVIDAPLLPSAITLEYARALDVLSPFGPGNPSLQFAAEDMRIVNVATVGKLGEHRVVELENPAGDLTQFIWWNSADLPTPEGRFDLVYTAHASNYRGSEQVQFEWIDFRQTREVNPLHLRKTSRKLTNFDYRQSKNPREVLASITTMNSITVWKEGSDSYPESGSDRRSIIPCEALAIWSVPPDTGVLRLLLQSARPVQIYWFLIPPQEHQIPVFLQTLGRRVKNGLKAQQQYYPLMDLAAQSATTETIAALGLEWLASSGYVSIIDQTPTSYRLLAGGVVDDGERQRLQEVLEQAFKEIRAFSGYLNITDLDKLIDDLA